MKVDVKKSKNKKTKYFTLKETSRIKEIKILPLKRKYKNS